MSALPLKADINLGFVKARIERMVEADPAAMEEALDWFDDLPEGEAVFPPLKLGHS